MRNSWSKPWMPEHQFFQAGGPCRPHLSASSWQHDVYFWRLRHRWVFWWPHWPQPLLWGVEDDGGLILCPNDTAIFPSDVVLQVIWKMIVSKYLLWSCFRGGNEYLILFIRPLCPSPILKGKRSGDVPLPWGGQRRTVPREWHNKQAALANNPFLQLDKAWQNWHWRGKVSKKLNYFRVSWLSLLDHCQSPKPLRTKVTVLAAAPCPKRGWT